MEKEQEKGWRCIRAGYGYYTFEVESYSVFIHKIAPLFVSTQLPIGPNKALERQTFVWRGMMDTSWTLQSSLSRHASKNVKAIGPDWQSAVSDLTTDHMLQFLLQLRGLDHLCRDHDELYKLLRKHSRRGYRSFLTVLKDMSPEQLNLTHELFALGQHHGLLTPFLDWTAVPLISLYFAFEGVDNRRDGVGHRVVFALNKTAVEKLCPPLEAQGPESIMILGSMAHDNRRIVAQSGVFTFVPAHLPVDEWVVSECSKLATPLPAPVLIRFLIRNENRADCLAELSACNIHARSVYPDLFGVAWHSNYLFNSTL